MKTSLSPPFPLGLSYPQKGAVRRTASPSGARSAIVTTSLAGLLCLGTAACQSGSGSVEGPGAAARPARTFHVETTRAQSEDVEVVLEAIGTLNAAAQVTLRPQVAGILAETRFIEGGPITKDSVLVRLDDSKAAARVALTRSRLDAARARLTLAKEQLGRYRGLAREKLVAREEYAALQAEFNSADAGVQEQQAALALAEAELTDYTLLAPFDGTAGLQLVDVGNYVEKADALVELFSTDPLEVRFSLPPREASGIDKGMPIEISDRVLGKLGTGRVSYIDPVIDEDTRMLLVKALIANDRGRLRPGQFVEVRLVRETRRDSIVIPEEAIVPFEGQTWIYVANDGVASRRLVEVGVRLPGRAEVVQGLAPGEEVIVSGQHRLSEGAGIEIVNADAADPSEASQPAAPTGDNRADNEQDTREGTGTKSAGKH